MVYGKAVFGEASLLRVLFMVHYLCLHAYDDLQTEANKEGKPEFGCLPHKGEVGRWWSLVHAATDIYQDQERLDFYI